MKTRWLLGMAIALVLAVSLVAGALLWFNRAPEPRTLVLAQDWNAGSELQALNQVLARFHSLYPSLTVQLRDRKGGFPADSDLIVASGFTAEQHGALVAPPVAWSGGLWVLAARTDILDVVARTLPTEVSALRGGTADPDQFRKLLAAISASGKVPLTLGNSHQWPFLLWLQHWGAATLGPSSVDPLPTTFDMLQPAFDELMDWKAKGWFVPEVWKAGWAQGLQPLDAGNAAFALVSEGNLGAIQNKTLAKVEFLSFPSAVGSEPWNVGSALYLGALKGSNHPEEAQLLLRYLTSPGVTQELTAATGRPFFSWSSDTALARLVVPSWAEVAMSARYNALSAHFNPNN